MHDFRRLSAEGAATTISPKLTYEIRRAHDRREWALEMIKDIDEPIPAFEAAATLRDGIEDVAGRLRQAMRVSLADQTKGRSDSEAFKWWRNVLENAGILTLQATTLKLEEARGFSISMKPLPVVVVNIKDAQRGRIFTLLHEVTHILLSEGGICDLHDAIQNPFVIRWRAQPYFPKRHY